MMEEGKQDRAGHGGDRKSKVSKKPLKPTLAEVGIDKSLAHRARRLATHSENKFVQLVKEWREEAIGSNDPVSSIIVKAFCTAQEAKAKKERDSIVRSTSRGLLRRREGVSQGHGRGARGPSRNFHPKRSGSRFKSSTPSGARSMHLRKT